MQLDGDSIVSIVEIAVYTPAFLLSILVCNRHGFRRSSGWLYTLILCLLRIIGSACQLSTRTNDSIELLKAAIILDSIGLTPLLPLATLGMLSRLLDGINLASPSPPVITVTHFRLLHIPIVLGAVFGIIGAESNSSPNSSSTWSDVAAIAYAATFAVVVLIYVVSVRSASLVPKTERILVPAVGLALPFVFVRLLYQILAVFVHQGAFARIGGSVWVRVFMAVVEEFVVVAVYLFLGFQLDRLKASEQGPIESRPWKSRGGERRRRQRGHADGYYEGGVSTVEEYPIA